MSSVLAIGEDDGHKYFIYYLPSERIAYEWINEWVRANFSLIANRLGPEAVLVTAVSGREKEFLWSISNYDIGTDPAILMRGKGVNQGEGEFLHDGLPLFVVSRYPLNKVRHPEGADAMAVNLTAVESEERLSALVDSLIDAACRGEADLLGCATGDIEGSCARVRGARGLLF